MKSKYTVKINNRIVLRADRKDEVKTFLWELDDVSARNAKTSVFDENNCKYKMIPVRYTESDVVFG